MHAEASPPHDLLGDAVLAFAAPDLEDRFVRLGLVETGAQAAQLFAELKKYLLLTAPPEPPLPMVSALVDCAWHHFMLFSAEYTAFCQRFWGRYLHHAPADRDSSAAPVVSGDPRTRWEQAYESRFGALPDLWYDERLLRSDSRLSRPDVREFFRVELEPSRALLVRERGGAEVVCRTSLRARPALDFIAEHPKFIARELPGLRGPSEQLGLLSSLVQYEVLRLAF